MLVIDRDWKNMYNGRLYSELVGVRSHLSLVFILRFAINKPEIRFNGADSKYLAASIPHTRCSSGLALVALSWHLG